MHVRLQQSLGPAGQTKGRYIVLCSDRTERVVQCTITSSAWCHERLLSTACLQSRESFRVSEKVGVSALPEILVDDMGTSLPHNRSVSAALKHCGKWWRDGTVNMVDQALNRGRALKREAMDVETYAITRHVRVVKLSPRSCLQTHKPNDAPLIRACTRSAAKCGSVPRQRRC